ncbi:MAG TPA: hypothetical protein VMZ53_31675 [Kofleriaceae bacterium]|nr:hypothetical protein [Kofleriaceae bacterium]
MKAITVLGLTLGTSLASASPIKLVAPDASKVELAVYEHEGHAQAQLTVQMSAPGVTTLRQPVTGTASITVPHGARFVGMSLRLGESSPSLATIMGNAIAERAFTARVRRAWDPALLRQHTTSKKGDVYNLSVYPLTAERNATVELILELPDGTTFTPAKSSAPFIEGVDASLVTITKPDGLLFASHTLRPVDANVALYADDPTPHRDSPVLVDVIPEPNATSTAIALRPTLRRRLHELQYCFAREATNLGALELHFAVVPSGRVAAVSVDGAGEEANQCVSAALANVTFSGTSPFNDPDPETTVVSYPLMWIRT